MNDLISIIIPVYNHSEYLQQVLLSLEKQTFSNIEIIIVDDGSENPIESVQSPLSLVWLRQEHQGAPAARNLGFRHSKGNYVLFLDADVICAPEMLEKMYETLEKNREASYVYSDYSYGVKRMMPGSFDPVRLKKNNYIPTMSLIRREVFSRFDESLKRFQDWDLWLTMLEQKKTGIYVSGFLWRAFPSKSGMSSWLPSFAYKFPFRYLPFFSNRVKVYNNAKRIVQEKHHLI